MEIGLSPRSLVEIHLPSSRAFCSQCACLKETQRLLGARSQVTCKETFLSCGLEGSWLIVYTPNHQLQKGGCSANARQPCQPRPPPSVTSLLLHPQPQQFTLWPEPKVVFQMLGNLTPVLATQLLAMPKGHASIPN